MAGNVASANKKQSTNKRHDLNDREDQEDNDNRPREGTAYPLNFESDSVDIHFAVPSVDTSH